VSRPDCFAPLPEGRAPGVGDLGARVQAELAGAPPSARDARRLVARTLRDWGLEHLVDSASLLVSEVVTNAVLHARTPLCLEIVRRGPAVRVSVADGSPRPPERRHHGRQAATGRGLGLLSVVASDWGSGTADDPWRKDVWFELPVDPAALPEPGEDALSAL
jgi:hypothetical protein